jgi:hypothetical protein
MSFILGALSMLLGLAGVVIGLFTLEYLSLLAETLLLGLATAVVVCGILEIAYGIGFLDGRGWSWTLGMIVAVVSLVSSIVLIGLSVIALPIDSLALFVISISRWIAIVPLITSSVTIYTLTRTHVKVFFGKAPLPSDSVTKMLHQT